MTFFVGHHAVILAKGKSKSRDMLAGNNPAEGSTELVFNNSASTIAVGEHLFISDQSDDDIQYRGLVTVADSGGVTTAKAHQTLAGTSTKIWTPTAFAVFTRSNAEGGQDQGVQDGVARVPTQSTGAFLFQSEDAKETVSLAFDMTTPTEYDLWTQFRQARLAEKISMAYWDDIRELSVCHKVAPAGTHRAVKPNRVTAANTLDMFVELRDTYVT